MLLDSLAHPLAPTPARLVGPAYSPAAGSAAPDANLVVALYSVVGSLGATSGYLPPARVSQLPLALGST
jgi:hypothetical protein